MEHSCQPFTGTEAEADPINEPYKEGKDDMIEQAVR